MRTIVGISVCLALGLAFTGVALAGPQNDEAGNKVTQVTSKPTTHVKVSNATAKQPAATVASAAAGALPFTGFQLGIAVVAGAGLLGAGIFVRRLGRSRSNDS